LVKLGNDMGMSISHIGSIIFPQSLNINTTSVKKSFVYFSYIKKINYCIQIS